MATRIEELDGELALCRAVVGNGVSSTALNYEVNVPKLKEFVGTRHSEIRTWEEFQHELKGKFYPEFVEKEAQAKL
ncbi:hypothetical protein PVK06_034799 [Gossypium arboreum]|uniref:Uncharacterized protein n=1 Tax=Gossypium arboreum TaxID=29729 RepID=A0ABR0NF56_GOSAR|nr:hypothetical protein PVK06_034799 [Gossypium arboreum]